MKLLSAVFAAIAVLAALLGFGTNAMPILCTLGKVAAAIALAGFAVTALAHATEDLKPLAQFKADDIPA